MAAAFVPDLQDDLRQGFEEGIIDDEDYLLLGGVLEDEGDVGGGQEVVFDFETWSDVDCWRDLRFHKRDIFRLRDALELGPDFVTYNRIRCDAVEGLCILLRRLAYPCRYTDMVQQRFGRSKAVLCVLFNHMLNYVYNHFGHLLSSFNQLWLSRENLSQFAEAIHNNGAPLDNCWGFIDGTVRPTCRPELHQRIMYNGHKRVHGFKFQSIVAPNGLIANFYGPLEGSRHDSYLLAQSGVLQQLEQHSFRPNGEALCVYGDPAYPLSIHLQTGFRNAANGFEEEYNQRMSSARVSVEWVFGQIIERFRFTDFRKGMKIIGF